MLSENASSSYEQIMSSFVLFAFGWPFYVLNFTFLGFPFYLLQGAVFLFIYSFITLLPIFFRQSSIQHTITLEELPFSAVIIVVPFIFSLFLSLLQMVLKKKIKPSWKHSFWAIATIDSLVYAGIIMFLQSLGAFTDTGGEMALLAFLGLWGVTIAVSFGYLCMNNLITRKIIGNLQKKTEEFKQSDL